MTFLKKIKSLPVWRRFSVPYVYYTTLNKKINTKKDFFEKL